MSLSISYEHGHWKVTPKGGEELDCTVGISIASWPDDATISLTMPIAALNLDAGAESRLRPAEEK